LDGGDGNDLINGDGGNDVVTGGAGNDVFQFETVFGSTTITDFTDGEDLLDLTGVSGVNVWADVERRISQNGADTVIALDGGTIVLQDVDASTIGADDFLLNIACRRGAVGRALPSRGLAPYAGTRIVSTVTAGA